MSVLDSLDKMMPILIVDDFNTMRRIVKNCLKQLGFDNIVEAENGRDALSKLATGDFKFIISEWNMPNMMGIELLRAIRDDPKLKELPFLMITAQTQKDKLAEATKAGVSNCIFKPFTADILQTKMETIFKRS